MKRLLLFAIALLLALGTKAQDIWLGAETTISDNLRYITLSKNGEVVATHEDEFGQVDITSLIAGDDGKVYYLLRHFGAPGDDTNYTYVYEHDGDSEQLIYDCPIQQGIFLRDLFYDHDKGDIYACGRYSPSLGEYYGVITQNDHELFMFDQDGYNETLYGVTVADGHVFACGERAYSQGGGVNNSNATVWIDDQRLAYSASKSCAYDIVYSEGVLWVCGALLKNGKWVGALWITSIFPDAGSLKDLGLLMTIELDVDTRCYHMSEDAGYLHIAYNEQSMGGTMFKIRMDNGYVTYGDPFPASYIDEGNLVVNNHGFYVASSCYSEYVKNGQVVTTPIQGDIRKIAVSNPRNGIVYDLPFTENFEYVTSHWDDWYAYDVDKNNGYKRSYWQREIGDPDIAAVHHYNESLAQQGELISPAIRIPSGADATLKFKSLIGGPEYFTRSDLCVLLNPDGVVITEDNVDSLESEVIKEFEPSDFNSSGWSEFAFDLSAYAGQTINLGFLYEGVDGHVWYIDDVEITSPTTNVNNTQDAILSLYPNPANDNIIIGGLQRSADVEIFNALGELVKTVRVDVAGKINVGGLSSGLYVVRCGATSLRFVKQ